jgi:hypothetical protein
VSDPIELVISKDDLLDSSAESKMHNRIVEKNGKYEKTPNNLRSLKKGKYKDVPYRK